MNKYNPDYLSIGTMLKARPSEESGDRFIYLEASRDGVDQHNERVLIKALVESTPHFLKFGNIDIDHKSIPSVAAAYGIQDPESWEIGIPEDVKVDGDSVLVKARLYKGDHTGLSAKADMVWDSMTKLNPPARWYASVGGATLAKSAGVHPTTGSVVSNITKVRWSNLAISRQPVNQLVSAVSTIPFGALAKCWTPDGFDMIKALDSSYATDARAKTGGAALGMQSLDVGGQQPVSYFDFRDKLSRAISSRDVTDMTSHGLMQFSANKYGLSLDVAAALVDKYLKDLSKKLSQRRQS